jgi:hypothetical protein
MKILLDSFVQKAQFETILDFAFQSLHDSLIPDHWKPLKELIEEIRLNIDVSLDLEGSE